MEGYERHQQLQDTIPQHSGESKLADDLNDFYCRFWKTPNTHPEQASTQPLTPPAPPPPPALKTSEDDMRRVFRENKRRKAQGPDSVSPTCFKTCADQLAPILNRFFNVLQQITGAVQSPLMFQMLDHHPRPKETQNYWTQWLQTCGSNMLLMK